MLVAYGTATTVLLFCGPEASVIAVNDGASLTAPSVIVTVAADNCRPPASVSLYVKVVTPLKSGGGWYVNEPSCDAASVNVPQVPAAYAAQSGPLTTCRVEMLFSESVSLASSP